MKYETKIFKWVKGELEAYEVQHESIKSALEYLNDIDYDRIRIYDKRGRLVFEHVKVKIQVDDAS
jgi:CRISPR/Cas system-associated endoribonuclease Cas2